MDWLYDSIKNGYALPEVQYLVKPSTSTPKKDGENIDPNFSCVSNVTGWNKNIHSSVNDTVIEAINESSSKNRMKEETSKSSSFKRKGM